MTAPRTLVALTVLGTAAIGCGRPPSPSQLVDRVTRAVYAGDYAATRGLFDDALRPQVTPQSVADVGGRMRRYGEYRGVTMISEISPRRRYDFEAAFTGGSMLIQVRFDPNGRLAAYRAIPNGAR